MPLRRGPAFRAEEAGAAGRGAAAALPSRDEEGRRPHGPNKWHRAFTNQCKHARAAPLPPPNNATATAKPPSPAQSPKIKKTPPKAAPREMAASPPPGKPALPPPWRWKESRSTPGDYYCINEKTGERRWQAPSESKPKKSDDKITVVHCLIKHADSRRPSSHRTPKISLAKSDARTLKARTAIFESYGLDPAFDAQRFSRARGVHVC